MSRAECWIKRRLSKHNQIPQPSTAMEFRKAAAIRAKHRRLFIYCYIYDQPWDLNEMGVFMRLQHAALKTNQT